MKIDLHCHTKATKKGDGEGRNVSKELFIKQIANSEVKILAITNHNHFDKVQYTEFREAVKSFCQIWPGVEIDVQGETKWHMIVVANPDNLDSFSYKVDCLFRGKNIDTVTLTMQEIYDALNECDVIYIPHYHKSPGIKESDRIKLEKLVNDESRVFLELSNHRSLGVYTNYGYKSIVGSDVKDWDHYDKCEFAELKLPVESFHQFCLLSKRDKDVVETLLNKKESKTLTAKPHEKVSFPVSIYRDVNIVFGPKGTGKTKIIESLCNDMVSKGFKCEKYFAAEKKESFKNLLSCSSMKRDFNKLEADSCEDDFKLINEWKETAPTSFEQYLIWYKTKDTSKNKREMRITESSIFPHQKSTLYETHKNDKSLIDGVIRDINKIELGEYIDLKVGGELLSLLTKLRRSILSKRRDDLIDEESSYLTNKTIDIIKQSADKSTDSISKPSTTGYISFSLNRIQLLKAVTHIIETIKLPPKYETEELGVLEEKGKLFITSRYRFYCDDSSGPEFKDIGYMKIKDIVELLYEIRQHIFDDDLPIMVKELNDKLEERSIKNINSFIGVSKYITDLDKKEYSPSNGEESIILLQRILNKSADAYFLDEPELGMGNSYIDATIRPMILDLAKNRKYVVIATHNANLAVRTLPYMTVFCTHGEDGYATYFGNPFNDLLVNMKDGADIKSWSEESLHILEGGTEAFYERKDIYESKNN